MSGPVTAADAPTVPTVDTAPEQVIQVSESRLARVGSVPVRRALPRRGRRTVGPWCFVDHFGPVDAGMDVGPHPHMGLHTVTWLVAGLVRHRDSLGSDQLIRPGQLNLMVAGEGVAHSEETPPGRAGSGAGPLHGVQLWIAQPEATRHGPPDFEHHTQLPQVSLPGARATVLVGELAGSRSPARKDTPTVGAELDLAGETEIPLDPAFEHALVVLSGVLAIPGGPTISPRSLAYLGQGRQGLALLPATRTRVLLIGGQPFAEPLLMWWNFVGRDRAEFALAAAEWNAGGARFGRVDSTLAVIPAPSG